MNRVIKDDLLKLFKLLIC